MRNDSQATDLCEGLWNPQITAEAVFSSLYVTTSCNISRLMKHSSVTAYLVVESLDTAENDQLREMLPEQSSNKQLRVQLYSNSSAISKNTGIWTMPCYQLTPLEAH